LEKRGEDFRNSRRKEKRKTIREPFLPSTRFHNAEGKRKHYPVLNLLRREVLMGTHPLFYTLFITMGREGGKSTVAIP